MTLRWALMQAAMAVGCVVSLSSGNVVAQEDVDCEDFIVPAMAQTHLERYPDDPDGLDPDGNGIACDEAEDGSSANRSTTAAGDGSSVEPATFEIVEEEFQLASRPRVVLRVVIEPADDDATAAAMAAALAQGFADYDRAIAAHVFAYSPGDNTSGGYTRGIARGTRDGLGWTGDGRVGLSFDQAEDELGVATVVLDSAVREQAPVTLRVPLDLPASARGTEAVEAAYIAAISDQRTSLTESLEMYAELIEEPRIGQDDWTFQVAAIIVSWRFAEDEAQAMNVPPAFASAHDSYLQALRYLNLAGDDFVAGLDALDPALISSAAGNLELGTAKMEEATEEFRRVMAERGISAP